MSKDKQEETPKVGEVKKDPPIAEKVASAADAKKSGVFSKIKNSTKTPVIFGLAFLILILGVGLYFGSQADKEKELQTIVIGDITITPEDVKNYANEIITENEKSGVKSADIEGSEKDPFDIALEELVVNAAIIFEAKNLGVSLSDTEIARSVADEVATEEQISLLISSYATSLESEKIPQETAAYQKKLKDELIVKKDITLAFVNYDTPFHKTATDEKLNEAYDETINRLNEIRELMAQNASHEELAKKVDLDYINGSVGNIFDTGQFTAGPVVSLEKIGGYSPGEMFNDIDAPYLWSDRDEQFDTNEKLSEELVNVGDVSSVFAAKSGMHVTVRLDDVNNGKYTSWEDLKNQYFKENVKYAASYFNDIISKTNSAAIEVADKAVLTATEPGLETAHAQSGETCSQRRVTYQIVAYEKDQGRNTGRNIDSNVGIGGARPSISFLGQNAPGDAPCVSNPDVRNGFVQIGGNAFADCMYSTPNWGGGRVINGPSTTTHSFWGLRVGYGNGNPWASPEIAPAPAKPAGGPLSNVNGSGNFAPAWAPSTANLFPATIYIFIIYEKNNGGNPQPGTLGFNLEPYSDCTTIRGVAFFRRANGTDVDARWRVVAGNGTPGGWAVGFTAGGQYNGNFRQFQFGLGGNRPTGEQIWGELGGWKEFIIQAEHPASSTTPGRVESKRVLIRSNGCGTDGPVEVALAGADCTGVTVTRVYDRNAAIRGLGVSYFGSVFHRNADGSRGPAATIRGTGAQATFAGVASVPPQQPIRYNFNIQPINGYNNGYVYEITAQNINQFGYPDGSRSAGASVGQCYSASCSVSVDNGSRIPGAGGNNYVEAGQQVILNASIRNNGPLAMNGDNEASITLLNNVAGRNTTAWKNGEQAPYISHFPGGGNLAPGQSRNFQITLTAPNTVEEKRFEFYPDFWPLFRTGGDCPITLYSFKPFEIGVEASRINLLPDEENPNTVEFESIARKLEPSGDPITIPNVSVTRNIVRNGTDNILSVSRSERLGESPNGNRVVRANITRDFGDVYCGFIVATPQSGWIGPGDRRVDDPPPNEVADGPGKCDPNSPDSDQDTSTEVHNKPYVRTYGGDVVSGAGFKRADGTCPDPRNSSILTYMRPTNEHNSSSGSNNGKSGSGSQLATFTYGSGLVRGFASATLRTSGPNAGDINHLTFGNLNPNFGGPAETNPLLGGLLNESAICLPDYFNESQYPSNSDLISPAPSNTINVRSLNDDEQSTASGTVFISGTNFENRHTLYVDGDAVITDDVTYVNTSGGQIADIPNFTLVVRGNIYIDRGVNNVEGTYIAQPRTDGSGGMIFTCASGSNAHTSPTRMYDTCGGNQSGVGQLRVTGSFIADSVILNRSQETISSSVFREGRNSTNAAEVFVFSPDVYLSPPVFRPNATVTSGDYQYIATLPPIL